MQRRPARGLLAGLWQPAAWEKALTRDELTAALAGIGVQAALDEPLPPAKHVFTHKIWELGGWKGTAPACALPEGMSGPRRRIWQRCTPCRMRSGRM